MQLGLRLACAWCPRLELNIPATDAAWAPVLRPTVMVALVEPAWLKVQLCYYLGTWAEVQSRAVGC